MSRTNFLLNLNFCQISEPLWIEFLNFSCLSEKFRGIVGLGVGRLYKDLWDTIHDTEILKKKIINFREIEEF